MDPNEIVNQYRFQRLDPETGEPLTYNRVVYADGHTEDFLWKGTGSYEGGGLFGIGAQYKGGGDWVSQGQGPVDEEQEKKWEATKQGVPKAETPSRYTYQGKVYERDPQTGEWALAFDAGSVSPATTPAASAKRQTYSYGGFVWEQDPATGDWYKVLNTKTGETFPRPGQAVESTEDPYAGISGFQPGMLTPRGRIPLADTVGPSAVNLAPSNAGPQAEQMATLSSYQSQLKAMIASGDIDPETANKLMDAYRKSLVANARGTTLYQQEQADEQNRQDRLSRAGQLIGQKLAQSSGLAGNFLSSALSGAGMAMMPAGKTSLGLDPLAIARSYSGQQGGDELSRIAQALMSGAQGGQGGPMSEDEYQAMLAQVMGQGAQ